MRFLMEDCIRKCTECHDACQDVMNALLASHEADGDMVSMLIDCMEICQTSANFMKRHSQLHAFSCSACADICERTARKCERMQEDLIYIDMQRCVKTCHACAASCREMSKMTLAA